MLTKNKTQTRLHNKMQVYVINDKTRQNDKYFGPIILKRPKIYDNSRKPV